MNIFNLFSEKKIVTRFAPSPTGFLHLGNYRTAIFAYLFARKNNGKFILRIEDTDKERSKKEYEENILESLKWLGISFDSFYRQSENVISHTKALQKLIDSGNAYISYEEAKDGSGVIKNLVRFKNPKKVVIFDDLIRGTIKTDVTDLGDFIIAKSLTEPLFHLAVVVDDNYEGVTHIIRGEDHIANTPRQILIREALGLNTVIYAHIPLVLAQDRTKLSKRKGAQPVTYYRDQGYLPSSLLNFMAFIGFNPGGEREVFNLNELIEVFDLSRVQKGGAIFNEEKLKWINREHILLQSKEDQFNFIKSYMSEYDKSLIKRLQAVIIERISNYGDLEKIKDSEFGFFLKEPDLVLEKLLWKDSGKEDALKNLKEVRNILQNSNYSSLEDIKSLIMPYAEKSGKGNTLWPLRICLTGQDKSMDPFTIIYLMSKEDVILRISKAESLLQSA